MTATGQSTPAPSAGPATVALPRAGCRAIPGCGEPEKEARRRGGPLPTADSFEQAAQLLMLSWLGERRRALRFHALSNELREVGPHVLAHHFQSFHGFRGLLDPSLCRLNHPAGRLASSSPSTAFCKRRMSPGTLQAWP
jgi:hypothetical protein